MDFLSFPPWETTFATVCFSAHRPSEAWSILNKKSLLPREANSFLLEWAPFHKGDKNSDTVISLESVSTPLNTCLNKA